MGRRFILRQGPSTVGAAWARSLCASIKQQGRPIAGGWPGTIVEARARIALHLHQELATRGMPPLCQDELDVAANATYARAKEEWLGVERSSKLLLRQSGAAGK
jgi:hypothetical protein